MDDQLKHYTKFHISSYTTLITAIIAVFANDTLKRKIYKLPAFHEIGHRTFRHSWAAGGLVASSIPFFMSGRNGLHYPPVPRAKPG